jgi:integrase
MPRPVKDAKLDTRTARSRLKSSGKPYYRALDHELHLGYRKGRTGGRWVRRSYLGDRQYELETIGTADDHAAADGIAVLDWWQAQALARERHAAALRARQGIGPAGPCTVRDALDSYIAWFEVDRKSIVDTRSRIEAMILPELGDVDLARLTAQLIRDWHEALARAPARLRSGKGRELRHRAHDAADPEAVRRRKATANRSLTVLKAALNRAWREGKVATDAAWRTVQPFRGADAARVRHLSLDECRRLINGCAPDFRRLVQGALMTGCRYGELCALAVADFHADSGTVHVRVSKSGHGRHVHLTDEGVAFFAGITAGRPGVAPMFQRADGARWGPSHQRRPLRAACAAARIVPACDFHTARHTYASLAIKAGVPLMVVARNLGHVDARMCERHYGHLEATYIRDAIRAGAPTFGTATDSNVTPIR